MSFLTKLLFKPFKKVGFEDVKSVALHNNRHIILINTLHVSDQGCLITGTIPHHSEESTINLLIDKGETRKIIIYGRNNVDDTVETKYKQLLDLGFDEVSIYYGGMFEWLLLQDIYGDKQFPTTRKELDILKYSPSILFP